MAVDFFCRQEYGELASLINSPRVVRLHRLQLLFRRPAPRTGRPAARTWPRRPLALTALMMRGRRCSVRGAGPPVGYEWIERERDCDVPERGLAVLLPGVRDPGAVAAGHAAGIVAVEPAAAPRAGAFCRAVAPEDLPMNRGVEMYYSVRQAELLLGLCSKTLIAKLKAREFGGGVVNLGSEMRPDYRIPASGLNAWLDSRRVFSESSPIAARSVGELRRRLKLSAA